MKENFGGIVMMNRFFQEKFFLLLFFVFFCSLLSCKPSGEEPSVTTPPSAQTGTTGVVAAQDGDADGFVGLNDNCPDVYNPDQRDSDGNGIGDACDVAQAPAPEPAPAPAPQPAAQVTNIACAWNGAKWLSHGWDSGCAFRTGALFYCDGARVFNMEWREDPGCPQQVNLALNIAATEGVVTCDWVGDNWGSHGIDAGCAWKTGATVRCSEKKVTGMAWFQECAPANIAAALDPINQAGTIACNWVGQKWISHGWDQACAFKTGLVVTCSQEKVIDAKFVLDPNCPKQR